MAKRFTQGARKAGYSPGTLTYVGVPPEWPVRTHRIEYSPDFLQETQVQSAEQCHVQRDLTHTTWLNVDGIHDASVVSAIGQGFGLHPLLLEDVMNTQQKPKMEVFDNDILFLTLKFIRYNGLAGEIVIDHLSLVLGEHWLVSFQEAKDEDVFQNIRERLHASGGKTRKNQADYLMYCLLDTTVDHYFVALEAIGEKIEQLEDEIMEHPRQSSVQQLYALKRELTLLRKFVWPLRDLMNNLLREESPWIQPQTYLYLRNVADHVVQTIDTIENYRELIASLLDLYLSSISNKMNSIMQVLTVISVIFMPLTFLAGIYGMNFTHMPELSWRYGYPAIWGLMLLLAAYMLWYFKKKNWI
jgi:magnesium transporter